MLTVADELAFSGLDEQTRQVCEKIIDARTENADDMYEQGKRRGYTAGRDSRAEEIAELERRLLKKRGEIRALEDQLHHFGIQPNRQFAAPASQSIASEDFPRPMGATPRD